MTDIFDKIESLANMGFAIYYEIVDQREVGTTKYIKDTKIKTYSIFLSEVSSEHSPIEQVSFDSLQEGLEWMVKYVERKVKEEEKK